MTTIKLKNGSGAPTAGDLAQGEPALDLTNKRLYTENASGTVIEVGTNPGVDVTFADNRKAIFGASDDLQIYHNGSNSYIDDAGTGSLVIRSSAVNIGKYTGETAAVFTADGSVQLRYDNSAKFETTSTGIDVTGTAKVSTSMMVGSTDAPSRDLEIKTSNPHIRLTDTDGGYTEIFGGSGITTINADKGQAVAGSVLKLSVDATDGLTIDSSHDVSIPNGNTLVGTTSIAVGQGTTTGVSVRGPIGRIEASASSNTSAIFNRTTSPGAIVNFASDGTTVGSIGSNGGDVYIGTGDTTIRFADGDDAVIPRGTEGAVRDGAIDLGISNNRFKDLYLSGDVALTNSYVFGNTDGLNLRANSGKVISMQIAGSEKAKLDASGNLLVGNTVTNPSSNYSNQRGFAYINSTGKVEIATTANDVVMDIGKNNTNDGSLVAFRKEGTTVGSIGTSNSDLTIGTADTILWFDDGANAFNPASSITLGASNGVISLGTSGRNFKDLYLSGTVNAAQINLTDAGGTLRNILDLDGSSNLKVGTGSSVGTRAITFFTENVEQMRLDASGNLLVGTTSTTDSAKFSVLSSGTAASFRTTPTTATSLIIFRNGNGLVGSISTNGSTTAFNTSSDQRLKDNIVDAPSASDDIDAIQVRSFDWKVDGSHQKYGMVAQELQSVAPEAVSEGETEDDMMGVDYSKLVPMLVKEIQSLRARVAQLETN